MLPLSYRLKNKKDIENIFKKGNNFSGQFILLKLLSRNREGQTKIGFGVGLKFSKKAIERNKLKRWMREAVRARMKEIRPGWEGFFLCRTKEAPGNLTFRMIDSDIANLLKKAKLISKK